MEPFPFDRSKGLSHGTLECHDLKPTRHFLRDFLGLDTLRHAQPSFLIWKDEPGVFVACVAAGETVVPQGPENRWEVFVETAQEVDAARQAAIEGQAEYAIRAIGPVEERDGVRSFQLQDLDGNWWEINNRDPRWYDQVFQQGGLAAKTR